MKFQISQKKLKAILAGLAGAVSRDESALNGALSCVLVQAGGAKVSFSSNNGNMAITLTEYPTFLMEGGAALVPHRSLSRMVFKMSGEITLETGDSILILEDSFGKYTIPTLCPEDFPEPGQEEGAASAVLSGAGFAKAVRHVAYVSKKEAWAISSVVSIQQEENALEFCATDNVRLALAYAPVTAGNLPQVLLPTEDLENAAKLVDPEQEITLLASESHLLLKQKEMVTQIRRASISYFNYHRLIASANHPCNKILCQAADLAAAADRVAVLIDQFSPAILEVGKDAVTLQYSGKKGAGYVCLECGGELTTPMKIGINHRYLSQAAKAAEGDDLQVEMTGPTDLIVIRPVGNSDYLFLILPIRLE